MTFHYAFYLSFIQRKHHKSASRKRINRVWEAETIGVSRQISWSFVWIILFCSRPVVWLNTISPPLLLHNSEVNLFNREQPPNRLLVAITAITILIRNPAYSHFRLSALFVKDLIMWPLPLSTSLCWNVIFDLSVLPQVNFS